MNAFTGPTRRRSQPKPVRSSSACAAPSCSAGHDHVHAQREPPVGVEPLPQAAAADRAGSRARRRRRGHWRRPSPVAHGARVLERRPARAAGSPRRRARAGRRPDARRRSLASAAELTHSVWWSCAHSAAGPIAGDRVERLGRGRRPVGPAPPRASRARAASRRRPAAPTIVAAPRPSTPQPRRSSSVRASAQSRKWTCASVNAGQHAAPVEVDALVADRVGVALAHVDAARDQRRRRPTARAPAGGAGPSCRPARCARITAPVTLRGRDSQRTRSSAGSRRLRDGARRGRPRRGA